MIYNNDGSVPRVNIPVYPNAYGILSSPFVMGQGSITPPILASAGTRTQAPLALPSQRIGTNEMLMRVGGQIAGGSAEGGLNAIEKGTEEYGRIQDLNRSNALREYNAKVMGQYRDALAQKAAKGKGKPKKTASPYNAIVIQDLDRALNMIAVGHGLNKETGEFEGDGDFLNNVTGFGTTTMGEKFAGTPAADFAALTDTIKSNIGFDRLQQMRNDSPTGGALGQVSNQELVLLNSALGSLSQKQSPRQLYDNVMRIKTHYLRVIQALKNEYEAAGYDFEDVMGDPLPAAPQQPNSSFDEADAIVGIK